MALMKQVVSVANGTMQTVEMSAQEEAAFLAQRAIDQGAFDAQAARNTLLAEKETLQGKLTDLLITGDPVDSKDVDRYKELLEDLG